MGEFSPVCSPEGTCWRVAHGYLGIEPEWSRDNHRFRQSPVHVLSQVLLSPPTFKAPSVCVTNECFPNEMPPHALSNLTSRLN